MGAKRNAQIAQMFIMIAALLVIGASIYLGGKFIYDIIYTSCQVNDVSFKKEISDMVDSHISYGSTDQVRITAPCNMIALCFVDADTLAPGVDTSKFQGTTTKINISVKNGVKENIFKQYRDHTDSLQTYDSRIILRNQNEPAPLNDLCIPAVSGQFVFNTQGFGRYIKISAPSS